MSTAIAAPVLAGVDTWSPCWYLDPTSDAAVRFDARVNQGGPRLKVAGHTVMYHRGSGLLYAEGHPWEGTLCPPNELRAAFERLALRLREEAVPIPRGRVKPGAVEIDVVEDREGFAGIRRLDATANLPMRSRAHGLAVLAGIAALARAPGSGGKARAVWGRDGAYETVYFLGREGRNVLGRWYDKGVHPEAGGMAAPRGELIRAEDQRRWGKGLRRGVVELDADYVRGKFRERFDVLSEQARGRTITVAGPATLWAQLQDLVDEGELRAQEAERLAGYIAMRQVAAQTNRVRPAPVEEEDYDDGPVQWLALSRSTRFERDKRLRDLGLLQADGAPLEVQVDLGEVLDRALDEEVWQS